MKLTEIQSRGDSLLLNSSEQFHNLLRFELFEISKINNNKLSNALNIMQDKLKLLFQYLSQQFDREKYIYFHRLTNNEISLTLFNSSTLFLKSINDFNKKINDQLKEKLKTINLKIKNQNAKIQNMFNLVEKSQECSKNNYNLLYGLSSIVQNINPSSLQFAYNNLLSNVDPVEVNVINSVISLLNYKETVTPQLCEMSLRNYQTLLQNMKTWQFQKMPLEATYQIQINLSKNDDIFGNNYQQSVSIAPNYNHLLYLWKWGKIACEVVRNYSIISLANDINNKNLIQLKEKKLITLKQYLDVIEKSIKINIPEEPLLTQQILDIQEKLSTNLSITKYYLEGLNKEYFKNLSIYLSEQNQLIDILYSSSKKESGQFIESIPQYNRERYSVQKIKSYCNIFKCLKK